MHTVYGTFAQGPTKLHTTHGSPDPWTDKNAYADVILTGSQNSMAQKCLLLP